MPARTRTNSEQAGSSTREKLLDTAAEIMTERGNANVSLSDIGARSGLNTALVKYYFGNKGAMLFELLKRTIGKSVGRMDVLVAADIPPEEKVAIHIRGIVNTYLYHPYINQLLHHLVQIDEGVFGKRVSEEITKPLLAAQKKIIDEGVKLGRFREVDPTLFFLLVTGACSQLFLTSKEGIHLFYGTTEISKALKNRFSDQLFEIVLNGIMRPASDHDRDGSMDTTKAITASAETNCSTVRSSTP